MAILRNDTTVRSADGQTTSAIITAANIGNYGISTTSTYYIGTTQNVFNRASGAQTLTGVSIDGNAANITAYTINQNVGTGNAPSFTGMTSTAMLVASTSMNSVDDWQNSPISIRERGLVAAAQSANTYSPNLNFHWASRISNSLWMDANGNLSWGSYDGTGVPSSDGAFYVNNLYASIYFDKNNTSYYLDPANTGTSLLVAGKVGLGTTSAISMLDVRGSHASGYGILNVISTDAALLSLDSTGARDQGLRLKYNGIDKWLVGMRDTNEAFSFSNSSDTRLVNILQGGNVGIGTASPAYKLDVNGTARIANDMLATGNITIAKSAAYLILDGTNSDAEIYWRANSSNRWAAGMNVGDATENFNIYNYTTATTNFTILKASGNVGIGSTNPSQKLHVVGTGFASTDFRAPFFYDSDNTTYYLDPNASTSGNLFGVLKQNDGKFVRDSYFRTISGTGDYYASGASGWYTVASITLTTNCTGGVLYGTLYDNRYDGADTYQIAIVARAECDFQTNNESHYVNVGCTILGSTNITNYQSKIRVLLVASSANSRTYEVQFFETSWNRDTWQLETGGSPVWTIYSTAQAPGTSTGTARVFYISNKNADNIRANTASYSPIYYDSNDTSYYSDPAGLNRFNALNIGNQGALTGNTTYALGAYHNSRYMVGLRYSSGGAAYPWLVHDSWNGSAFIIHFNGVGDKFNFSESGIGQASGDFRAPIFYDSGDTTYYLDPANSGTSLLVAGKIGAGLTTPLHKIQATGLISASDATYNNDSTFIGAILNNDGTNPGLDLRRWNGGAAGTNNHGATYIATNSAGDTIFYNGLIAANTRATNEKMRIAVNGNVGIGTTSPTQLLDVRGNIKLGGDNSGNYVYYVTDIERTIVRTTRSDVTQEGLLRSDGWGNFTFSNNIGVGLSLGTGYGVGSVGSGIVYANGSVRAPIFYDSSDTTYYLDPANTGTALAIAGNAGVGTASPTLSSGKGIHINSSSGHANLKLQSSGRTWELLSTTGAYFSVYDTTGGADRLAVTSAGNVGVATTSADTNLQVVGHVHVGNQTTFDNTGGWNKTIYLDGTVHARMRIIGSAFASGKNSQTETNIWVDNSVAPYSGLTTNAGSFTINAGFTTLTNSARSPIFYDSDNTSYYLDPASTSNLVGLTVANTITGSISGNAATATTSLRSTIEDTRAAQRTPNDYDDYRASYEFTNAITGLGDWHSAFTLQGWHNGYAAWQIIGPASTSAHENFYLRSGVNTTWNAVRTILHSGNYNSYSPTLTGTGASGTWSINVTGNAGGSSASCTGNAATATTSSQLGGVAAANYVRNDVDGTNSTALFRLTTITKSLTITTSWLDTGIVGADLSTGCYMISVYVDNYAVNGGHYQETYTGMMSWFSTGTNSTDYDEIVLHKSGHASNGAYINLRTIRQLSGSTNLKLQIISSVSTNGASNYVFKFRRLI